MKRILAAAGLLVSTCIAFSSPSSSGATGTIEFPNAYNLRSNNYTVALNVDGIDKSTGFGLTFEGGFIPQVEAGVMLNNKDTVINESLLKSNFKFQFVQEADNPALALGFIESKDMTDRSKDTVYGYIAASKTFRDFIVKDTGLELSIGMKYDKYKEGDAFGGIVIPLFQKIKILAEMYSYAKVEEKIETVLIADANKPGTYTAKEEITHPKVKKMSYNIGGEFYTTDTIRTKIYWKEIDNTIGVSINYIGIYK